jgi:hypothetical protein
MWYYYYTLRITFSSLHALEGGQFLALSSEHSSSGIVGAHLKVAFHLGSTREAQGKGTAILIEGPKEGGEGQNEEVGTVTTASPRLKAKDVDSALNSGDDGSQAANSGSVHF